MASPQRYARTRHIAGTLLLVVSGWHAAAAADNASERAQLTAIDRQLGILDHLAEQSSRLPHDGNARYHFDYARLHADIARIRGGVEDYLNPPRAQPRDPDALLGDYRSPADGASVQP